jgi:uncharacterized protein DUF6886
VVARNLPKVDVRVRFPSPAPPMITKSLRLWHVSDDPHIEVFTPHRAPTAQIDDELVWAVDESMPPETFALHDAEADY